MLEEFRDKYGYWFSEDYYEHKKFNTLIHDSNFEEFLNHVVKGRVVKIVDDKVVSWYKNDFIVAIQEFIYDKIAIEDKKTNV